MRELEFGENRSERTLTLWEQTQNYIIAAFGGSLIGFIDFINKNYSPESVIKKISIGMSKLFSPETAAHEFHIYAFIFMAILGVVFAIIKQPKEKWDNFVLGIIAFSIISSFVGSGVPISRDTNAPSKSGDEQIEERFDKYSNNAKQITGKINIGNNKFQLISEANAQQTFDSNDKLTSNSSYILYLKGEKYSKITSINVLLKKNQEILDIKEFKGNKILLQDKPGEYQLEVEAETFTKKKFLFTTTVQITNEPSGGIIFFKQQELEPITTSRFLAQFIESYKHVIPKKFNAFETDKQMGIYYSVRKQYEDAIDYYYRALEYAKTPSNNVLDSDIIKLKNLISYAYFRKENYNQAQIFIEEAYNSEYYNTVTAWINYLVTLCAIKDFEKGKAVYIEKIDLKGYKNIFNNDYLIEKYCGEEVINSWRVAGNNTP